MEKVLEIYRWIADIFLPPGNEWACRKATMEGEKGLLEGGAGARGAGCSREPGVCTAVCCLVFWAGSSVLINSLPAGLLEHTVSHEVRASAEKFAGFKKVNHPAAQSNGGETKWTLT